MFGIELRARLVGRSLVAAILSSLTAWCLGYGLVVAPAVHAQQGPGQHHGLDYAHAAAWGTDKDKDKAANATCAQGKNQTPIDLHGFIKAVLPPLKLTYTDKTEAVIQANDHGFPQVDYVVKAHGKGYGELPPSGQTLEIDGLKFDLKQIHFHTPSENTINGQIFEMEGHFVHMTQDGAIAVLAVMFHKAATDNTHLAKLWSHLGTLGPSSKLHFNPKELLPAKLDYYRFNGSLTTPPCSEGLRWLVLKNSVPISKHQIEQFEAKIPGKTNARPVQPVNARAILE